MGAAFGEVAHLKPLNAVHASGQWPDVPVEAGQIAADVGRLSANVRSEVLVCRADLGAKGAEVATCVVPARRTLDQ